jgi:hypothetical protein
MIYGIILQITEDRKKRVIDLYFNQHKSYAEIAQIKRMSIRNISATIKEEEARRQKCKQQEISSQAYQLFSEGKTPVQVAITLNLGQPEVSILYREYWKLKRLHRLYCAHTELGEELLGDFLKLYRLMNEKGMSKRVGKHLVSTDGGSTLCPQACKYLKIMHHIHLCYEKSIVSLLRDSKIQYLLEYVLVQLMTHCNHARIC